LPVPQKQRRASPNNIVKNIFRLFQNWLEEDSPPELELGYALTTLWCEVGKFNNYLVRKLSLHQDLRKAFLAFSDTSG
jgi:hypothetical protein